jgi:hypothetical protein
MGLIPIKLIFLMEYLIYIKTQSFAFLNLLFPIPL